MFVNILLPTILLLLVITLHLQPVCNQTLSPTVTPTARPTRPTSRPTPRPTTRSPTRAPTKRRVGIYGDYAPSEYPPQVVQQVIVGVLVLLLLLLMAIEISTPEILFLIALIIVILAEILTLTEGLAGTERNTVCSLCDELMLLGFSNTALITIGTLFLVIAGVEKSHVVDWLARKMFGTKGSITLAKLRMYFSCFGLSVFFNNTPLVAILIPIVKDWGRVRGVAASQLLMPLSFAVLSGSFGSIIGTSTNLTVQGLMSADRGYEFSFFAPLPIGIVCAVALNIYMALLGPFLLPNKTGLISEFRDKAETLVAEVYVSDKAQAVGKSLADVMISLGLAPSHAFKIRRPRNADPEFGKVGDGVDKNYFKKHLKDWHQGANHIVNSLKRNLSIKGDLNDQPPPEVEYEALEYFDIVAPSFDEIIRAGDIIFMSHAQDVIEKMMKSILGESVGLYVMKTDSLRLPGFGTELVECVISDTSPLIGVKTSDASKLFAEKYKSGLITVRGKDWSLKRDETPSETAPKENKGDEVGVEIPKVYTPVALIPDDNEAKLDSAPAPVEEKHMNTVVMSEHILQPGDAVLCVTNEKEVDGLKENKDFYVVSSVGSLPKPLTFYTIIPCFTFVTMLVLVALERIDVCPAALAVTCFFFIGGWITYKDIPRYVDIRLLMLLGASLSFATSMTKSGLALKIAQLIEKENPTNFNALILVYAVTLVITELISNNAAAALMYPIAVGLADELGISFKPFAMAVLVASTAGFMSPIGYQTHVMVWAPGGYRFIDFVIFGFIPDVLYWFISCAVIPTLYPF